jgi:hypothetical protein
VNWHWKQAMALAITLFVEVACDPVPTVQYSLNTTPDLNGLIKFRLAKSAIHVAYAKGDDGKGLNQNAILVTSVPQEDATRTFTIAGYSGLLSDTNLKVKKRDNTDLLESIGVDVDDKRVKLINQVGGALAAVAPFILASGGNKTGVAEDLPQAIDVSVVIASPNRNEQTFSPADLGNGWMYELTVDKVPDDAVLAADFVSVDAVKTPRHVVFYAACRPATLRFISGPFRGKQFSLRISDPNFLQTVGMPTKGAVQFHTACGVDVSFETTTTSSGAEILNALITQAKGIIDAKNKKK